jgi:cyclase
VREKNPYKKGGMFEGASYLLFEKAKRLRNTMTDTEIALWMYLKKGINRFKFRRQHPIGLYIADFYCHKVKLIIEIDGSVHNLEEVQIQDKIRENDILRWGYNMIRFTNNEVHQSIDKVLDRITNKISDIINSQKQNASPTGGV